MGGEGIKEQPQALPWYCWRAERSALFAYQGCCRYQATLSSECWPPRSAPADHSNSTEHLLEYTVHDWVLDFFVLNFALNQNRDLLLLVQALRGCVVA